MGRVKNQLRMVILTISLILSGVIVVLFAWLFVPISFGRGVTICIPLDATIEDVINEMASLGIGEPTLLVRVCIHTFGIKGRLKAGLYDLGERASRYKVFMLLRHGRPRLVHVTIPPGLMMHEVAMRLERAGLVNARRFMNLVWNPPAELRKPWLPDGKPLEGFLFPETYWLPPTRPKRDEGYVIKVMLDEFEKRFIKSHASEIEKSKRSLYDIVILASMVEMEAKVDEERPIIAGVLLNRLKLNMLLQCDATIFYALKKRKRRITYSDLRIDSPYNTHLYSGMPPTPICNPGLNSLLSALNPADVDYLYYVARGDGRHTFSRTYEEHLVAVRRWRKLQKEAMNIH